MIVEAMIFKFMVVYLELDIIKYYVIFDTQINNISSFISFFMISSLMKFALMIMNHEMMLPLFQNVIIKENAIKWFIYQCYQDKESNKQNLQGFCSVHDFFMQIVYSRNTDTDITYQCFCKLKLGSTSMPKQDQKIDNISL